MPFFPAVVFDMDGTILNTLEDLKISLNQALEAEGFPPRTLEEVRQTVGNGYRDLMRNSCPPGTPDEVVERVFQAFSEHYAQHYADHTAPYEGIPELLETLKAAGLKLAVVSNKGDREACHLAERNFPGIFDAVIGQRDDVPRKPDPQMVEIVLREMGVGAREAVYVGDSEVDIKTATAAGLPVLLVTWGFRSQGQLEAAGGREFFHTVGELERELLA